MLDKHFIKKPPEIPPKTLSFIELLEKNYNNLLIKKNKTHNDDFDYLSAVCQTINSFILNNQNYDTSSTEYIKKLVSNKKFDDLKNGITIKENYNTQYLTEDKDDNHKINSRLLICKFGNIVFVFYVRSNMSVSNQFYVRDQPASSYNEIEEDIGYTELYSYDN